MKKKKILTGVTVFASVFLCAFGVKAADNATVTLTDEDKIEYTSYQSKEDGTFYLGDSFEDMAPGETRTQVIEIVNDNEQDATFYLAQETLQTLEKINSASGGAYSLELKVGDTSSDAVSVLDAIAGGYDEDSKAKTTGLSDITALEDYAYLADVKAGEQTNLYLTLQLEGEGMDHTTSVDYTSSVAKLGFDFRAYYDESPQVVKVPKDTVITQVVDKVVKLAKTGDETKLGWTILIMAISGGIIFGMIIKKRRKAAVQS